MQTFLEWKTRLRAELWPGGEPRSLRSVHDSFFNAAMLDIQKWVPCVREHNTCTYEFENTHWDNAKTVVNAPNGRLKRVYTVAGGEDRWRDKVRYRSSTIKEIECWSNRLFEAITPTNTGLPALALGVRYADESQDSPYGRARIGIWAIDRKRLYIAPYLQSSEMLVVDWDGPKTKWLDSDGVDETYWTGDFAEAVKLYVLWKHEFYYGDRAVGKAAEVDYRNMLADLIYWCRENTKQQPDHSCDAGSGGQDFTGLTQDRIDDDSDPLVDPEEEAEEDEVLFVAVGDEGDPTADAALVAVAIEAENPEYFVALGDNTYHDDYEADFAVNYQWAIDDELLIPVPGNHDVQGGTLDAYKEFFADFVANNGANYEKVTGSVHWFIYNSEDTDGINAASAQAEWLRVKMLLSTARWKIVVLHKSPYASDTTHGSNASLQLDFVAWGADVVLSAHSHIYERLEVGGLPYFVVGTGGRALYALGAPVAGSQFQDDESFGYLVGDVNCERMILTFKDVDGNELDSLTITKEEE